MQKTLFPEPQLEEISSLTPVQRIVLDDLIANAVESLLFDTSSFNPKNPHLKKNLYNHLPEKHPSDTHLLVINHEEKMIGYVAMRGGWNSYECEPASPYPFFVLVNPAYHVWKNEIMRELKKMEDYYKVADEEW